MIQKTSQRVGKTGNNQYLCHCSQFIKRFLSLDDWFYYFTVDLVVGTRWGHRVPFVHAPVFFSFTFHYGNAHLSRISSRPFQ